MTTRIDEIKDWASALSENANYEVSEGVEKELPDKPTVEQLKSALLEARVQTHMALSLVGAELESISKELDKLRNHRHDFSKTFSGRAEF